MLDETEPDSTSNEIFPGLTEWETKDLFCIKPLIYIPSINKYFLSHWEVSIAYPAAVIILILSSYFLDVFYMIPSINYHPLFIIIFQSVFCFLFLFSYYKLISDGPGYFPFYWPLVPDGKNDDEAPLINQDDPSPAGIISTETQEKWACCRDRPNRCVLSKSARRIVIRPDHFCDWAQSWVGKKNYKFFLLFNTYGFIYLFLFLATDFVALIYTLREATDPIMALYLIYFFLAFVFLTMTGVYISSHCQGMIINQTNWEEWNNIPYSKYDKGCLKNVEDVCGPSQLWYLWPFPTTPFGNLTNSELIADYEPYKNPTRQND